MKRLVIRLMCALVIAVFVFLIIPLEIYPRLLLGLVIGLPSFILMILARRQLGKYFSIMPEAKGLVKTGLYSKFQHPMYFFLDLFLLGVIIILNLKILLLLWMLIIILQVLQSNREESVLRNVFGPEYEIYSAHKWF